MDYKLELHNYSVDGRVTDIEENTHKDLVTIYVVAFNYFNKKLECNAKIIISSYKSHEDCYKNSVTFVKRLK